MFFNRSQFQILLVLILLAESTHWFATNSLPAWEWNTKEVIKMLHCWNYVSGLGMHNTTHHCIQTVTYLLFSIGIMTSNYALVGFHTAFVVSRYGATIGATSIQVLMSALRFSYISSALIRHLRTSHLKYQAVPMDIYNTVHVEVEKQWLPLVLWIEVILLIGGSMSALG